MGETTHQQAVVRHPMNELNSVFTTDSELESQGNNSMSHLSQNSSPDKELNKKRVRLCRKQTGKLNTRFKNISQKNARLVKDIFVTVVDLQWRYLIFISTLSFFLTWTGFGLVYYALMWITDDFDNQDASQKCFANIKDFPGALLFSLETQTTIGYGYRTLSENCPLPIIVLCIHSIFSVFFESVLIAMTLAKIVRSNKRKSTIVFSKYACIAMYNSQLCFMCRLGDLRGNSNMFEAHVRMYFVHETHTQEGEVIPVTFTDMDVGFDQGRDRLMVITPMIIRHVINCKSPLYHISAHNLPSQSFEVLLVLEGNIEQIGVTAQCRTSYTPDEIYWGHYFQNCIERRSTHYMVNYALFDSVYQGESQQLCSVSEKEGNDSSETPQEDTVVKTSF
ncbi:ATP-sensitive inward rectifier potassium channel 12-like isoform X2 [Symsagittifera roscoffensis]|uniref:ATP-sensitive inward rectifier potassium channel 12-like isoform X2 n=1 Tax=Symsagittifera roscoffensis TaxID=84072 RepID=UPI00307B74B7